MSGERSATSTRESGDSLRTRLAAVRDDPTRRWVALALAAVVGLAAAWVHWFGLVLGGALVGLVSSRLRWAVVAGLGFGALVLVTFVVASPALSPGELLALRPPVYVTVGAGLGLPLLGSLVRGVV